MSRIAQGLTPVEAGQVFTVEHPFCREDFEQMDADGPIKIKSWRPGVRFEMRSEHYTVEEIDGLGAQILTVVAVFKPGRFPTRVFYTRKWRAPDGKEFGKSQLHIKTLANFRAIIRGYRYQHDIDTSQVAADFAAEMERAKQNRMAVQQ